MILTLGWRHKTLKSEKDINLAKETHANIHVLLRKLELPICII